MLLLIQCFDQLMQKRIISVSLKQVHLLHTVHHQLTVTDIDAIEHRDDAVEVAVIEARNILHAVRKLIA